MDKPKHSFKEMAELYPDKREYFLDLHEQFERDNEREIDVLQKYKALGLSTEDISDYVRLPKKFLKLLQWYMEPANTSGTPSIEKMRVLEILKTLFDIKR